MSASTRQSITFGLGMGNAIASAAAKQDKDAQQKQQAQKANEEFYQNQMAQPSAPARMGSLSKTAGLLTSPTGSLAGEMVYPQGKA